MIPKAQMLTSTPKESPSRTYRIDWQKGVIAGFCDGLPAMEQAVQKILDTQRFQELIYSWRYGTELADLIGSPVSFVYPELERRITEALLQDDRIFALGDFAFTREGRAVTARFTVKTAWGDLPQQKEVQI